MRISYHWLVSLLGTDPGLDKVASKLTLGGLEVEDVERVGEHLRDVVVAEVLSSRAHPTSKNPLTLVTVDAGEGPQEVVCGAPNVPPPGGRVALAKLGATVFDKKGGTFKLEARPVAGVVSAGMLCAEDELGLGNDHGGILILDASLKPGAPLSSLPGMVDQILTLNVTPNRGDALSHRGVAREVAALFGIAWRPSAPPAPSRVSDVEASSLVRVEAADVLPRCERYLAGVVTGVTVGPSPLALRVRLHRLGVRPINNLVDVTNLVMLELGQPLHAFDRDELRGARITVRTAAQGERLLTLDGVERALDADDLVIADDERVLALAGVMGGEHSGIQSTTRDVVIECAWFDPRGVRRTARRYGMHTESSHRFERRTDPGALDDAVSLAVSMIADLGGGAAARGVVEWCGVFFEGSEVPLRAGRAGAVLGADVDGEEPALLTALGFEVRPWQGGYAVKVPSHRGDITREIDLVEEVARVWGVDRIPATLPPTRGARAGATRDWRLRRKLRDATCALGFDEAIHMVFISPREVASAGLDPASAIALVNPLSEERSLMRPSLLPKLLAATATARRRGEQRVRLFELGSVFERSNDALPRETTSLGFVMAGPRDAWLTRPEDVDLYDLKGAVEELVETMTHAPATFDREGEAPVWAHPRAWARVLVEGRAVGFIAATHPDVVERADLGRGAVIGALDVAALGVTARALAAKAPSRFPASRRDVALLVRKDVPAGDVLDKLRAAAGPLCESVTIFDRYAGPELPEGSHSLAFALTFRADDRTLLDGDVDALIESVTRTARDAFGAAQR